MPSIVDAEQGGIPHSLEENPQSAIKISKDFIIAFRTLKKLGAT